jgi:hypothetical protein
MSDATPNGTTGTDWTRLLTDPELVQHLGKLLQTYREAPAEKREEALLVAMREIKSTASREPAHTKTLSASAAAAETASQPVPTPAAATPPFQPDIFGTNFGQDRRKHYRIKCFVAVELRVNESEAPIWGNLSNTSLGGCLVETAMIVASGSKVAIGLWLPNDKIWVKGFALTGIVTGSAPASGVRIRFEEMEAPAKENLRQFLRFVQEATRSSHSENSYLELLK